MTEGCRLAKRDQPNNMLRQYLLAETGYSCPICGRDFWNKKGSRRAISAEAAHIYPLNPTLEDCIALADIEPPQEINDASNFIMLCPACHDKFDKPRTKEEYLKLRSEKDRLSSNQVLRTLRSEYPLEREIRAIIEHLTTHNFNSSAPLSYTPLRVTQKLFPDFDPLLAQSIKDDVLRYYPIVRSILLDIDSNHPAFSKILAGQVKLFYLKTAQTLGEKRQVEIFYALVDWIKTKAQCPASQRACEIIVSYFIQDCEVFEDVSQ